MAGVFKVYGWLVTKGSIPVFVLAVAVFYQLSRWSEEHSAKYADQWGIYVPDVSNLFISLIFQEENLN